MYIHYIHTHTYIYIHTYIHTYTRIKRAVESMIQGGRFDQDKEKEDSVVKKAESILNELNSYFNRYVCVYLCMYVPTYMCE